MVKNNVRICLIVFTVAMCFVNTITASEYGPWENGDYAVYVDSMENVTKAEIKSSYPRGLLISSFFPDPSVTVDREPPIDPGMPSDIINVYLIITNNTGRDLTYTFNSGQLFEIEIIDSEGNVVSLWSRDKAFTEAIQMLILRQGESWKFGGEVELATEKGEALPAGNYTIVIEMTSSPDEDTDHKSGSERIGASAPLSILHAL
ncbi:MAG: hypothetical protein E3K37_12390 [Candidatus Kuenenia sp.]|nr:hypothetical protein [Candidatus Kuenenia hertensis]